jgi:hypothetical protein
MPRGRATSHRHARRGALGVGGRRRGGPEWSRGRAPGWRIGRGLPSIFMLFKDGVVSKLVVGSAGGGRERGETDRRAKRKARRRARALCACSNYRLKFSFSLL